MDIFLNPTNKYFLNFLGPSKFLVYDKSNNSIECFCVIYVLLRTGFKYFDENDVYTHHLTHR